MDLNGFGVVVVFVLGFGCGFGLLCSWCLFLGLVLVCGVLGFCS